MKDEEIKIGQKVLVNGCIVYDVIDCFVSTTGNTRIWKVGRGAITRFVYALELLPYIYSEKVEE